MGTICCERRGGLGINIGAAGKVIICVPPSVAACDTATCGNVLVLVTVLPGDAVRRLAGMGDCEREGAMIVVTPPVA